MDSLLSMAEAIGSVVRISATISRSVICVAGSSTSKLHPAAYRDFSWGLQKTLFLIKKHLLQGYNVKGKSLSGKCRAGRRRTGHIKRPPVSMAESWGFIYRPRTMRPLLYFCRTRAERLRQNNRSSSEGLILA